MKTMSQEPKKTYVVPAVNQAIRLMLCLADSGSNPKSLTEICEQVAIHRSKAFSILNTLSEYGFVKKNSNRRGYVLGPGLLTLSGKIIESLSPSRVVEPILSDLAKKAGATVSLGVISDDKTFIVAEYQGAPGIGISSPIGYATPISYGAHGKAIAAFLPAPELEELLKSKDLYFYGTPAKYNEACFKKEILLCRGNGFAVELGDVQPGVNAVASVITDQNGNPVGYVSIVGFFTKEMAMKLGPLTAAAVKVISKETGHMLLWQKTSVRREIFK
jgi:DNA-binding IclR family transcriptional regulator